MAYVPPHLRLASSSSPSSQESRSSFPRIPSSPPQRGKQHHRLTPPQPDIHWIFDAIRRFVVASDLGSDNESGILLQFSPFHGQSFPHLQGSALFTLTLASPSCCADRSLCQELQMLEIGGSLEEDPLSTQAIPRFDSLREDLCRTLTKVKDYVHVNPAKRIVPSLILRFGTMLFHCDPVQRASLDWHKSLTPRMLENAVKDKSLAKGVRKTFDTGLTSDFVTHLEHVAMQGAPEEIRKERYIITVQDNERPKLALACTCCVATDGSSKSRIILRKVRIVPFRYMVADIACIGKKSDLRLIVRVGEHVLDLRSEEKQELQEIFDSASIHPDMKGGLHWPLNSRGTSRFKVTGAWHMMKRLYKGESMRWKFDEANRTEYLASSGRASYEVEITSDIWKDYLKGRGEHSQEEIVSLVEGTMDWIWKNCL